MVLWNGIHFWIGLLQTVRKIPKTIRFGLRLTPLEVEPPPPQGQRLVNNRHSIRNLFARCP